MHCPSINVFGTFFPSWMLCALAGMVFAVVAHQVLAAVGLHPEVKPSVPVYGSLALAATFLFWLVGYGS